MQKSLESCMDKQTIEFQTQVHLLRIHNFTSNNTKMPFCIDYGYLVQDDEVASRAPLRLPLDAAASLVGVVGAALRLCAQEVLAHRGRHDDFRSRLLGRFSFL